MSNPRDTELDDVLQDPELLRLAHLLSSVRAPEPPLDDAFRSGLRRQLMQKAWEMGEGRAPWWRRILAPPNLAWAGAAVGVFLIASFVWLTATSPPSGNSVTVYSPLAGTDGVALAKPILVSFNQPMDHASTEAAVQIAPATNVAFSWQANTLSVQPTSGTLAPNTQYQVTIGPSAKTQSGQSVAAPQTITFVTQPPPSPVPTPSPSAPPTPTSPVTGERQLAPLAPGIGPAPQWSADSSTVYLIVAKGALVSFAVKGGDARVLVADGVSAAAIAPAGDRIAYIRSGKIEILTLAAGTTAELTASTTPSALGWVKDKLLWGAGEGVYAQGSGGPVQLVATPSGGVATVVSIAPDGAHAVYLQNRSLQVLDLSTGKSTELGTSGAQFLGWSPDGARVMYSNANGIVIADGQGKSTGTLPVGDASWSAQDEILLGSDTDLYEVRPDGSAFTKLADGTYRSPTWAPNGMNFTFVRGGAVWTASGPTPVPLPIPLEEASAVVTSFMQARLAGQADAAKSFLDDSGKKAYSGSEPSLIISGDPGFSRFYVLTKEVTAFQPDTARIVVRLVLAHGKLGVSDYEEALTLQRDQGTRQFVIDQVTASPRRDLGKGAEVVGVEMTGTAITVTFDSDLQATTVSPSVSVVDGKGKQLSATAAYANRTVTLGGLELTPGAPYRLVVQTTLRDVSAHGVASEYELQFVGPAAANTIVISKVDVAGRPTPSAAASPAG